MPLGPDALIALVVFAFVTSITPGPNNLMLLASGVNFGFRRSVPHMFGIGLGFAGMLAVVGLGLGAAITASPTAHLVLKTASVGYMLFLAWKLATATGPDSSDGAARPMRFVEAALFQWINPKAWAIAVTATAVYTRPDALLASVVFMSAVYGAINLPSVGVWAAFGVGLRGFLSAPSRLRAFNIAMAVLLAASVLPFVFEGTP